jgi:hypothetical protein
MDPRYFHFPFSDSSFYKTDFTELSRYFCFFGYLFIIGTHPVDFKVLMSSGYGMQGGAGP